MNPDVAIPLALVLAAGVGLVLRLLTHRERMAALAAERSRPSLDAASVERVERMVESLAVDMERLQDAQRFMERALTERVAEPGPPR